MFAAVAVPPIAHASILRTEPRIINESFIEGDTDSLDRFGEVMAFGDFDRNDLQDLVIGHPFDDHDGQENAGIVTVLYDMEFTPDGIEFDRDELWHFAVPAMPEDAGVITSFGAALVVGDFDGDFIDDLAIGAPITHATGRRTQAP